MRRRVLLLVLGALLATSCEARVDLGADLEPDGGGEVVLVVLLDGELRDALGLPDLPAGWPPPFDLGAVLPDEWDVAARVDGDVAGFEAVATFPDGDALATGLEAAGVVEDAAVAPTAAGGLTVELTLGRLEDRLAALGGTRLAEGVPPGGLARRLVLELTVRTPGPVLDVSAGEVEGRTAHWRPESLEPEPLRVTSGEAGDGTGDVFVAAAVVVAAIAVLAVSTVRRGRERDDPARSRSGA